MKVAFYVGNLLGSKLHALHRVLLVYLQVHMLEYEYDLIIFHTFYSFSGTRVIAICKDNVKRDSFLAGIVAEPPLAMNRHR